MKYFSYFLIALLFPVSVFASCVDFPRDLKQGMKGPDVYYLQRILNSNSNTLIAKTGETSPGHENESFTAGVTEALKAFQYAYSLGTSTDGSKITVSGIVDVPSRVKLSRLSCEIDVAPPAPVVATSTTLGSGLCPAIALAPAPRPKVTLLPPLVMNVRRGDMFSLYGANFTENNTVDVDGKSLCGVGSADGGRRIDMVIPLDAALGVQYVRVTDRYGVSNLIKINILPAFSGSRDGSGVCLNITRGLQVGSKGKDVLGLQKFLNSDSRTQIDAIGKESYGKETEFFTSKTKIGVQLFQKLYAADILRPAKLTLANGVVGALTRKKIRELSDCPVTTDLPVTKEAPQLAGVWPSVAAIGDQVVITGNNFGAQNTIHIGSKIFGPFGSADGRTIAFTLASNTPLGKQNITVSTSAGSSNIVVITITSGGMATTTPRIISFSPTHGKSGDTIQVNGSGFSETANAIASVYGNITLNGLNSENKGTILKFRIPAGAKAGAQLLQVVNVGGKSNTRSLTVDAEKTTLPPSIDALNPAIAKQGSTVVIEGHNFSAPLTVYLDKVPLSSAYMSGGSTRISFTVPVLAAIGTHQITVETTGGMSNQKSLEVIDKNADVPVVISATPNSFGSGETITISGKNLKGTNFIFVGGAMAGSAPANASGTTLSAAIRTAKTGEQSLHVTNANGVSNDITVTITVNNTPTLTSVYPATVRQGEKFSVRGLRLTGGSIIVDGQTITPDQTTSSASTLSAVMPVSVTVGSHKVHVRTAGGESNELDIEVTKIGTPEITTVGPNPTAVGGMINIMGNYLGDKVSVHIGSAVVPNVSVMGASALTLNIPSTVGVGTYDVWVTTPGGDSNKLSLTVTAGGTGTGGPGGTYDARRPKINSLSATSMTYEQCFLGFGDKNVTIYGENFSTTTENTIQTGLLEGNVKKVSPDGHTLSVRIGLHPSQDTIQCLPSKFILDPSKGFDATFFVQNQWGTSNGVNFTIKPMIKLPF